MIKNKISYSAWSKFMLCPQSYNIYYNERLEAKTTTSALVFGSAIDEGLNEMYLNNADPVEVFQENFKYKDMKNVIFHRKDLNRSLFTQDQLEKLRGKDDHYMSWAALRVRGRILLEYYQKTFYKKITKIYGVQKELSSGRRGFTDLIAAVEMEDQGKILIDHKASYYPYSEESAKYGAQLVLYAAEEKIDKVAYCVLLKDITTFKKKMCSKCGHKVRGGSHKTCNKEIDGERCKGEWDFEVGYRPEIQWISGKPSKHMKDTMKATIDITENMIIECNKTGYPRNYSTCDFVYGRQCEYYNYCHKNDKSDLKKRK